MRVICPVHYFFVELIEPTEGLSLIHSCSRSRTNRQIHKEAKWHTKNIILQFPQISFTFLDYIKIVHSTEGNFLFGSSLCSWDHLANYSLKWVLKYGAPALWLARKYKISLNPTQIYHIRLALKTNSFQTVFISLTSWLSSK